MGRRTPNRGSGIRRSTAGPGRRRRGADDAVSRRPRRASVPARGTTAAIFASSAAGARPKQSRKARRMRALVVGLAHQAIGQGLGPRLHERAVHQVQRLDGHVRRLAVAGDQARLGEVEQVQHVGQPVAEDRQVDRAVPRRRRGRRAGWLSRPISEIGRSPISLRHERADAAARRRARRRRRAWRRGSPRRRAAAWRPARGAGCPDRRGRRPRR